MTRSSNSWVWVILGLIPIVTLTKQLQVVTTTTDLKAITEAVGGEFVSVTSISTGKQDPHFIEAKPSYMIKLRKADLFIRIGLQLEIGWEPLVLQGSRNGKIQRGTRGFLDASAGIKRLEVPTGPVDRSLGDVHTEGNPHYWLDPYNGRIMAQSIAERLGEIDPEHHTYYQDRLQTFVAAVDTSMFGSPLLEAIPAETLWVLHGEGVLDKELRNRFGSVDILGGWALMMLKVRGVQVVTYHKSWTYFLKRFGMLAVAQMEPKPGVPPSPKHILKLINLVQEQNIPLIIMEPFYSEKAPRLVSQKTGLQVLKIGYSVGGDPGTEDYLSLMDTVVKKITAALTVESLKG